MKRSFSEKLIPISAMAFFALVLLCLAGVVLFVPYEVHLKAYYRQDELVSWYWRDKHGTETEFKTLTERQIREGEGLRLGESTGILEIQRNRGAFAYLSAGADLTIEKSTQEGLFWEHLRQSEALRYQLILKQTSGLILYDFSQSDPPLAELNLIIRLPEGDYQPKTPCFQASESALTEIPCGNLLTPSEALSLP